MDDIDEATAMHAKPLARLVNRRDPGVASLRSVLALASVWALTAAVAFWLGDGFAARFLDLPLSAYLAGQGALMAAVGFTIRLTLHAESAPTR